MSPPTLTAATSQIPSAAFLYGGDGGAMNRMFAEFLQSIEPSEEQNAEIAFVVDDLLRRLTGKEDDRTIN